MSAFLVPDPSSFARRGKVIARKDRVEAAPTPGKDSTRKMRWIVLLLLALAAWQFAGAAWIHAKALVAQRLIASSWEEARRTGTSTRPWPWADTRPIARLTLASRGVDLYVLDGASGRSLAFGPGHVSGTARPGSPGNSVIVAHRDTHFAFLRDVRRDDELVVEDESGRHTRYRVREAAILDKRDTRVLDAADSPQLTLITCYPFEAVRPGTPQRYVVIADRVA
jgi:sortase A